MSVAPERCRFCGSDDLEHRKVAAGIWTACIECEATAITPHGSKPMWSSGRARRRYRAAVDDTLRRFESD